MGTMRERTPGTWELTVSAGLDPGTGRYRRVIRQIKTTSKREAKAALAELETTVANGRVSFDDQTVSELLDRWLEHITGLGRSATTLYHYRQYVDREIVPVLGGIRLSKLSTLEIDALYTKLRKRGLAPATIRQIHAILRASLNQAERWGLVQRNVAKLASAPAQPQREQHPPSIPDVRALMTSATNLDPLFGLFIRVMVATGAGVRKCAVCVGPTWISKLERSMCRAATPCCRACGAIHLRSRDLPGPSSSIPTRWRRLTSDGQQRRRRAQCAGCRVNGVDPATSSRWIRLVGAHGVPTRPTRSGRGHVWLRV